MNNGEISACHYATGEGVRVVWESGRIVDLGQPIEAVPADSWIAPALIDLQVNGYGGIDFQQDDLTLDGLLRATRGLRSVGCTRYLLTLITAEWPRLIRRLQHYRRLRQQSAELAQAIAGWHIEGPFLSAERGFCGAHNPALMIDPRPHHLRELREVAGDDPVLLTLAPERTGAVAAIAQAVALGIKVSLGHTNASAEVLTEAQRQGAVAFTHLGNGCPRDLDRHDNILWRVFELSGLLVSLIPDGTHVSPALFRLAQRELGAEAIYYISDAMAAAGMGPGRYPLGALELEVGADGIVRLPGQPNFAGSSLRPIDGVFRAAAMLRCSWREVWSRFSEIPACLMGFPAGLERGCPADFCLLRVTAENRLANLETYAGGLRAG